MYALKDSDGDRSEVAAEGKAEATTYDAFGCFCKSKTDEKTKAISSLSSTLEEQCNSELDWTLKLPDECLTFV